MIKDIKIDNFRGFKDVTIENCAPVNVIVGDNGSGKTALLEAIFLSSGPNLGLTFRISSYRGYPIHFGVMGPALTQATWQNYFRNFDWSNKPRIDIDYDGKHLSLEISKLEAPPSGVIPLDGDLGRTTLDPSERVVSSGLGFLWKCDGRPDALMIPRLKGTEIVGEYPEDPFLECSFFAAGLPIANVEVADGFSKLSILRAEKDFVESIKNNFPAIQNLSVESIAGQSILHAEIEGLSRKIPLNLVSSGICRIVALLLALKVRGNSVVLIDEIETGIHHAHKDALCRSMLELVRTSGSQMFVTTHDEEWLRAIASAPEGFHPDVQLWRVERAADGEHHVRRFQGERMAAAVNANMEVR